MDPNLRTAKVRLEVHNPGMMRLGMFVNRHFLRAGEGSARHRSLHRGAAPA